MTPKTLRDLPTPSLVLDRAKLTRNIARMATLLSGLPDTVPAVTVNRLCASGLEAIGQAARAIAVGDLQLAEAEAWGAIVRLRLDGPDGAARGVLERSRDQLRAAYGDDHHLVARATQELARSAAGS